MSSIKFIVSYNKQDIEIECDITETILCLKKKIMAEFKLVTKYIDLDFKIDRPIRSMGKFNLDKGIMPRTFDNYTLDRWELVNKTINCSFIEIRDYKPFIKKSIVSNKSRYIPPSQAHELKSGDEYIEKKVTFDINSKEDFPTL